MMTSISVQALRSTFEGIADPILAAVRREAGALLAKLHRMDFGKDSDDPLAVMGGGASPYMKDLADKLSLVKNEILAVGFDDILNIPRARDSRTDLAIALLNDAGASPCARSGCARSDAKPYVRDERILEHGRGLRRRHRPHGAFAKVRGSELR